MSLIRYRVLEHYYTRYLTKATFIRLLDQKCLLYYKKYYFYVLIFCRNYYQSADDVLNCLLSVKCFDWFARDDCGFLPIEYFRHQRHRVYHRIKTTMDEIVEGQLYLMILIFRQFITKLKYCLIIGLLLIKLVV